MKSKNWRKWNTIITWRTCITCKLNNGCIYAIDTPYYELPPLHEYCRCFMTWLEAIYAGQTSKRTDGADWWLKHYGTLPDYCVTREEAERKGWNKYKGNLGEVLPGKMLAGGRFYNSAQKLPYAKGRIWYEADLNYNGGYRGLERVVYSNDGLVFITKDHYENFIEVI